LSGAGATTAVAITGMACRLAGARSAAAFWDGLCGGVEYVRTLTDEQLLAAGVAASLLDDPAYVRRRGVLEDVDLFAAPFFGYTPREAELMDPQQRFFLECAYEALENAACDPGRYGGLIGVFGTASANTYRLHAGRHRELAEAVGVIQSDLSSEVDYLASRVSYKLDLRGPSMTVQTACSSGLVAVHLACQSLLNHECDTALAGAVAIQVPQAGYRYREGGIGSADGRCRAFDSGAAGTVGGDGVGVVVLKRLADAQADGDHVYAVIRGSAVNNDGASKVGFTAPSVRGQAEAIAEAQAMAGVDPRTVRYVECHGTGTVVGDPIELEALTQVFGAGTDDRSFCAIGSVKTNVGHLDVAAGLAGLVKATLAVHHGRIPASLHFREPNPACRLDASPFYVNTELSDWPSGQRPRRAGVSSFGLGGTNAHVVLEEAPPRPPSGPARPGHLLVLSARSADALDRSAADLGAHLRAAPGDALADVAYTSQVGRQHHDHRAALVCDDREEAMNALLGGGAGRLLGARQKRRERPVVFLFPGQGAQHLHMGEGLYRHEPAFRAWVDRCCEALAPDLGLDLRTRVYAADGGSPPAEELAQTWLAQPALFVTSYAMAQTWIEWGVVPDAMIGHSLGEYVAACVAGVLTLDESLRLVARRGRLMQAMPPGAMLSVALPEDDVSARLPAGLSIAAVNGPAQCVVSGPRDAIEELRRELAGANVAVQPLRTSHAFHSPMLDAVVEPLVAAVGNAGPRAPQLRYASNLTGDWITPAEATDPAYWGRQMREPVRFSRGLRTLLANDDAVLLEVGPGTTLSGLARRLPDAAGRTVVASMRHPEDPTPDRTALLRAIARLWLAGVSIDWAAYASSERRRRLPLPAYPFERQRYWIDGPGPAAGAAEPEAVAELAVYPRSDQLSAYVPPANPLETRIATIWRDLIGIDRVGRTDDFFELGGGSLLATQLMARLVQAAGVDLPVRFLFEHPTVARLAEGIEDLLIERLEAMPEADVAPDPGLQPVLRGDE
jgi:phthiocerol/phenolphthiocerol synthesis type-I polyketide synthase E